MILLSLLQAGINPMDLKQLLEKILSNQQKLEEEVSQLKGETIEVEKQKPAKQSPVKQSSTQSASPGPEEKEIILKANEEALRIREEAESYHDLIPWMIRLSLGIALIGAGIGGSLISPVVGATALESFLEILAGFLFLSGFLLFPACIISLALFSLMVGKDPLSFVGTLNVLALLIIFLIKGNPKPGVDAILGFPTFRGLLKFDSFSPLILRVGTGVCFFSLALYEKLLNPHWSEYVVHLYNLQSIVPVSPAMWVLGAGVTELLLGILLILGFQTRMVAAVSLIVLSLSFFFFKEQVYSHITLFGALSILFVTGAARVSIDAHFRKR